MYFVFLGWCSERAFDFLSYVCDDVWRFFSMMCQTWLISAFSMITIYMSWVMDCLARVSYGFGM